MVPCRAGIGSRTTLLGPGGILFVGYLCTYKISRIQRYIRGFSSW
jgi:hypothetical protein